MLPSQPSFERIALNRVTFGARASDEAYPQSIGWDSWVAEQLNAPAGDDSEVAQLIANATLHIQYAAKTNAYGGWAAVNEDRPLTALSKSPLELWDIYLQRNKTLPGKEVNRIAEETVAATWMRNTHSAFPVREFMVDFWHNHFNVAVGEGPTVRTGLAIYDEEVIRPNVFSNFRTFLEADATSVAMLFYLDNAISKAEQPNENYAREVLELHTIGARAYLGEEYENWDDVPGATEQQAIGYTDQDVIEASKALSGWTVGSGSRIGRGMGVLPKTGEFHYEPQMHNETAGHFLGVDLSQYKSDLEQGRRVLDVAAYHESTAIYTCERICHHIFGDFLPSNVLDASVQTWMDNQTHPEQLKLVMDTILMSPEIGELDPAKVRLPYQKTIAFLRAVGATVMPHRRMFNILKNTKDTLFTWPSPDGHPDYNGYWLNASSTLGTWNSMLTVLNSPMTDVSITDESLATSSVTELVEDWVGRIIGYGLQVEKMDALMDYAMSKNGILTYVGQKNSSTSTVEYHLRQLVGLIATSEEFAYR